MARNIGYLTSKRTPESDEVYTPPYAVNAIAKYIPHSRIMRCVINWSDGFPHLMPPRERQTKILCPFDKDEHAFPTVLRKLGYDVVNTHYDPETGIGKDFFSYTKEDIKELEITHIVSNPPFSEKDKILEHCEELNVPYALLLPLPTLQGNKRYKNVFSKGTTQALIFDKRIPYSTREKSWEEMSGNHFASIFICKDVLSDSLVFDELETE